MTHLFNDPATFADEALDGFCDLHAETIRRVPGGAVRRGRPAQPKVVVLPGGGSGHYPAFFGVIGPGFADGAVSGNIFTSPSTADAYSVAKAAHCGAGVVFSYGNYAGDVMNFGMAAERLRAEGVEAECVLITDDIASAPVGAEDTRRGIAGDFTVFKVLGAAAEEGADLAEVVRLGRHANDRTRSVGATFDGCTFPGATAAHFHVPAGQMGLGLGIHGEPGLREVPMPTAAALGADFVARVLAEKPEGAGERIAVILNGLGATKAEELFVVWTTVAAELRAAGYILVQPEVGELVTSLDMAGISLTVTWLDEDLERLWCAPAWTPAFTRGFPLAQERLADTTEDAVGSVGYAEASAESAAASAQVVRALTAVQRALHDAEDELGRIDAIAGDGDHGRGMVRGIDAAVAAATGAAEAGAGLGDTLAAGGDGWADRAGGTSGVLWGAGLRAAGERLGNQTLPAARDLSDAVGAFTDRLIALGGAAEGDKTMMDALLPFRRQLCEALDAGARLEIAWRAAQAEAEAAAVATAQLLPKKGRARPLAEKSLGTPDAGATSMTLILGVLGGGVVGG